MELLDAIYTRRCIRKFTGKVIADEMLQALLRAGMSAPSAHDLQPWRFVVMKDMNVLELIAAGHPYAKMLPQAGCGIMVCGDRKVQEIDGFIVEDCSAAIQNMLLAAHDLGLGAVWCGIHPIEPLIALARETLHLPEHIMPVGLVVIGEPDQVRKPRNNYAPEKVHYDRWQ